MERALISLGKSELTDMIETDGQADLTCHFCRTSQHFTREDLQKLLEKATRA